MVDAKQAALERASEAHARRGAKMAEAERRVAELAAAHGGAVDALASREAEVASSRQDAARLSEQLHVRPQSHSCLPVTMAVSIVVFSFSVRSKPQIQRRMRSHASAAL